MEDTVLVASTLHGRMTDVPGRYRIGADGFELLADGPVRSGGRGEAAGAVDLLVASLVVSALNAFRRDLLPEGAPDRRAEIFARVERELDERGLGTLVMECLVEGVDADLAERLVDEYQRRSRIYRAVRTDFPVVLVVHAVDRID